MARTRKPPARDRAIHEALSRQFRAGDIYAYSYDEGVWLTWTTVTDWEATVRNGKARDPEAHAAGHGPTEWDRDRLAAALGVDAPAPARLTKAQLVARLRAIADTLPPEALEALAAA